MLYRPGRVAGFFAACILLTGCRTYPAPGVGPTAPLPPPAAVRVYRAVRPVPLPDNLPTGLLSRFGSPPAGYAQDTGLLFAAWPSASGPADGLYLQGTEGAPPRLLVRIAPGRAKDVATSSAIGEGYLAYQVGPESGPATLPLELQRLSGGRAWALKLPADDRGDVAALPTITGGYLDFLAVRDTRTADRTAAVSCRLPQGPCRDLISLDSDRARHDVIAVSGYGPRLYAALNPVDPAGGASAEIISVPQAGGHRQVLWQGPGVITSIVPIHGGMLFTMFSGTDGAIYLLEGGGLARLTVPGDFPSHPSYGAGYVTWWDGSPCVFQIGSGRAYRVPGSLPELFGNLLTFVTPQGVRWVRLPPT